MIYQLSIPRFFLHEGDDFSWRFRVNCPSPGQVPAGLVNTSPAYLLYHYASINIMIIDPPTPPSFFMFT
jgi:hypothetical protein